MTSRRLWNAWLWRATGWPLRAALTTLIGLLTVGVGAQIPRTASGHPDLSGTYNVATLTPLQRPQEFGDNLYLTPAQAEKIAAEVAAEKAKDQARSDPNREAPPEGDDGSEGAAGNVGGYNAF